MSRPNGTFIQGCIRVRRGWEEGGLMPFGENPNRSRFFLQMASLSVKATVTDLKGRAEKLSPKESPEDALTFLSGAATKGRVNIRGTS